MQKSPAGRALPSLPQREKAISHMGVGAWGRRKQKVISKYLGGSARDPEGMRGWMFLDASVIAGCYLALIGKAATLGKAQVARHGASSLLCSHPAKDCVAGLGISHLQAQEHLRQDHPFSSGEPDIFCPNQSLKFKPC